MQKLKRFVECTIPISSCNLRCSYCYVIQQNRRDTATSLFRCTPEEIGRAFHPERWGGHMLVNLCAYGETMLCKELPDIVLHIIEHGHFINITNNGTITKQIIETINKTEGFHSHLCFAFSLHYVELKNKNLLRTFADNVHRVKDAGCSFLVQLNLADEYIEILDEIKEFCLKEFNAYPQVALTRREGNDYEIFTKYTESEYHKIGSSFNSALFSFTYKNFRQKRNEFCYAGNWTYKLDLASGDLRSCYFCHPFYNIYDHPNEKIKKRTVGNNCGTRYCINSSHFMSLGVIPEIPCPSYVELRDRGEQWYTPEMRAFLNQKLFENNHHFSAIQKKLTNYLFRRKETRQKETMMMSFKKLIKKLPYSVRIYSFLINKRQLMKFNEQERRRYLYPVIRNALLHPRISFLVLTPVHGNLGDHAIAESEKAMLRDANIPFYEVSGEQLFYLQKHKKLHLFNHHPIFVTGGGFLGTLWFHDEEVVRNVIRFNPASKIILFPNTVYYEDSDFGRKEFENAKKIYGSHRHLHLYARERYSEKIMKQLCANVSLVPDVVMRLRADESAARRHGCLICMRSDREKTIAEEDCAALEQQIHEVFETDVRYTDTVKPYGIPFEKRENELNRCFDEFRSAELVVTDRLHGMIFSAITGSPCIVINSKSPKVLGSYEWLRNLKYIRVCENVHNLKNLWEGMPHGSQQYQNEDLMAKYMPLLEEIANLGRKHGS